MVTGYLSSNKKQEVCGSVRGERITIHRCLCKAKCQKIPIDLHKHRNLLAVFTCKKIKGIRSRALPYVRVRRHTHNLCGDLLEMCVLAAAAIGRKAVSVEILPTK